MKGIKIQVQCDCPHCENGRVQHPHWAKYWAMVHKEIEESGKPHSEVDTEERVERFFRDNGYGDFARVPEEIKCYECNGSTQIYSLISLEALKELLGIQSQIAI